MENKNNSMNDENARNSRARISMRSGGLIAFAIVLVTAAIAVWLLARGSGQSSVAGRPVPAPLGESVPAASGASPRPGEMIITLSPDKLDNAHIKIEAVIAQPGTLVTSSAGIRTTGSVASNSYKEVPVFPIAGGIVKEIKVELGTRVTKRQELATIFSTDLSDAEAAYLKVLAEVEEHHQHHHRTTELVEIGAASREDLEQAVSMYKAAQANLASARDRLILLGLSEKQVDDLSNRQKMTKPLITVASPSSGVVINRAVNTGEVVMQGKEMFRVADLSSVWVIGQIYERDFQTVNIGTPATITTQAYPGRVFNGRVSYIDPKVDPQTRTAQVRIELANPREMLKLGMYVDVSFGGVEGRANGQALVGVPRSAVQTIGAKQVVFVATDRREAFVQRDVSTGSETNGMLPVYSGLSPGERVVTEGSFLLRAESLKLNPAQAMSPNPSTPAPGTQQENEPREKNKEAGSQAAIVHVTEKGYAPDTIKLRQGVPAQVTFVRDVEATCGTAVVIPEFNIKRDLPFNEPVVIEFTPAKRGTFKFTCGMGMLEGKIVVR
jgi:cobalt-zinc-cadmium efflux system membrane fusion protein